MPNEKPWTTEQEAEAREWLELSSQDDFCLQADRLYNKLKAELGEDAWETLQNFVDSEPSAEDGAKPDADDGEGIPELLPFTKLPGYLFDRWGVPYRQKGQGRSAGKVALDNRLFFKKGSKTVHHMARYRLTVNGKQKPFYPRYLMRARLHAEQEFRKAEVSTSDSAKGGG